MKMIAVLTSGGDAPGMNATIRTVVLVAKRVGIKVIGIKDGYRGLCENHSKDFCEIRREDLRGAHFKGGTILGTSRYEEFQEASARQDVRRILEGHEIEGLIVIGGQGSLRGAGRIYVEHEFPIIGIPASIDNDIWGTDWAIGVDTALTSIVDCIAKLRDTASSHHRAIVVETMGRDCGFLATWAAIASSAEVLLIPECKDNPQCDDKYWEGAELKPERVKEDVLAGFELGKTHMMIVVSEGIGTHVITPFADALKQLLKPEGTECRHVKLGHLQRGGRPTPYDVTLACRFGEAAVSALCDKGLSGRMVRLRGNDVRDDVTLEEVIKKCSEFGTNWDQRLYDLFDKIRR